MSIDITDRMLIGIGLGGIATGWLPPLLQFHAVNLLPFNSLLLVDGKKFRPGNRNRQHFLAEKNKAEELQRLWGRHYPQAPLRILCEHITAANVAEVINSQSVVLLSPDAHPVRKLVSRHAETLDDILLIVGGNDAIDKESGKDGAVGCVMVHCKIGGKDTTPPITRHHPEIAQAGDEIELPGDGCGEAVQSEPQLAATNWLVGQAMADLLLWYCQDPEKAAESAVERWINSKTHSQLDYGLSERPV